MPEMISLRKFRLETTLGHVIQFESKKPKYVPDDAVADAMKHGCVPADESDTPFFEDMSRAKVEFQGDVRKSLIYLAVKQTVEKNDHRQFDGADNPKHEVLSDLLGFEVFPQEAVAMFQQYLSAKKEGIEFPLHPAAVNVQRVMECSSKTDLVDLAVEFDVPEKKAKGLVAKDLRKLLLVKFSGIGAED